MSKTKKIALSGMLTALAFGLSYIEFLIPFDFGVPGIKLGLANIVVMFALYSMGVGYAALISLARITLSWLIFGSFTAFIYSLCGGILSLLIMILIKRINYFDEIGVSISGAFAHNIAQLAAASVITGTGAVFYYLPVLTIAAVITGALNGEIIKTVLARINRKKEKS